ncbi:pseudouridine synthase [Marinobacter confluentis]|uniref:Pseudouridine synthase n=2 Tax=Marinobacter confluentis TaxID=1697557 RepID=A0A4Z1C744_9GAMM|nr:pseudouridine synthase [Marinobacter confluentis]TGN41430.1 pseudouridine synthase [Marinobacter confluentis]
MAKLILFNKPFQVLSQFTDNSATTHSDQPRATLADWIPVPDVYPAGRLDFDSEGLLLLTDSGTLQHQIASPKQKLPKTYWVQVEGQISDAALDSLRHGVVLKDGKTRPARVERLAEPDLWTRNPPVRYRETVPTSWISLTITEGRNRQVRRMTAATGFPTLRLVRYAIGEWTVADLAPGQYKILTVHAPTSKPARRNRKP